ncbi:MAG: glucose-1-phosphate thymidylyltransferase [Flavobacteriales bacterium]|nr:glucose-1-phosphate thymidylyltransferase [Flavobacteriales bacterium]|tara:strand:- start:4702 stop:5766 length:1065 start_codon:yes stop_codon:yes gene_type:complete
MNYILFDPPQIERFYPFTMTRPLCELRVFGGTIKERWEKLLGQKVSFLTSDHLSKMYPLKMMEENNYFIPSNVLVKKESLSDFLNLLVPTSDLTSLKQIQDTCPILKLINSGNIYNWHVISQKTLLNDLLISFELEKKTNHTSNNYYINEDDGPVLIEENVDIMDGVMIRGPVHICSGSIIKMGAKIYGPTIIGPHCRIGGEVSSSIFLGYSNKAHDGFIGNSIIGEWCNIGAGSSCSNLRNDYSNVKIWDYISQNFQDSSQQFLGLYMGDHSKCAINTTFNTGTTIGVSCNIFGSGFHRNYITSFSWGGSAKGFKDFNFEKAISVAKIVMLRRNIKLTQLDIEVLRFIYDKKI